MTSRRRFLTGLLATGLAPRAGWADAGDPSYLSAARLPDGTFALAGLTDDGRQVFRVPLPARGHAAAAHPSRPLAVAFARRPGRFALVIDCATGRLRHRMDAPEGHHFYGHGAFSADGSVLFTTENAYDAARGMIGLWDVGAGFRRIGAVFSGGIGPHEIRLMPDGATLVVANGGIETHPGAGRAKLNLPAMRPNLAYVSTEGALVERHEPPAEWHMNSIRHLALRGDGLVAIACQWQGAPEASPPLLATHRRGQALRFHDLGAGRARDLQGYLGSVAFSGAGDAIAVTGPRGGAAHVTDTDGRPRDRIDRADICGVAPGPEGFIFTTGEGLVLSGAGGAARAHRCAWDNHLVAI